MNKNIAHIIITRFNLAVKFRKSKKQSNVPMEQPWLNEEYLERRFQIFEEYTFHSLLEQTDKNFKWIVLFHKDTPTIFKEKIENYCKRMQQMEAWFLDDNQCENLVQVINDYLEKNYVGKGVITTRIDNDDVMHKTFVEEIKSDINYEKNMQVLTYTNGLQYDCSSRILLKYEYVNNHFMSMYVSPSDDKENIMCCKHTSINKFVREKNIEKVTKKTSVPMWVEVITETNCANTAIWKFSTLLVPLEVVEDYQVLKIKLKTKAEWFFWIIISFFKVFNKRIINFFEVLSEKIVKR